MRIYASGYGVSDVSVHSGGFILRHLLRYGGFAIRVAVLVACVVLAGCIGKAAENAQIERFARIVREHPADTNFDAGRKFLGQLTAAEQKVVGLALLTNANAGLAYLGANVLIEQGEEDRAIPLLATFVVNGTNDTQFHGRLGYEWVHVDDAERAPRVMLKICGRLLDSWERYTALERQRAELFLRGLDLCEPSQPFSVARARERLSAKQQQLKTKPGKNQGA